MKLGILQCDDIAPEQKDRFHSYPAMFQALFKQIDPELDYEIFAVHQGNLPDSTNSCDAYLITGSQFGVYETHEWLPSLEDFVRSLYRENRKLIGICFGHQLMAQALGGTVTKSDKGWGAGLSFNVINSDEPWMQPLEDFVHRKRSTYWSATRIRLLKFQSRPESLVAASSAQTTCFNTVTIFSVLRGILNLQMPMPKH